MGGGSETTQGEEEEGEARRSEDIQKEDISQMEEIVVEKDQELRGVKVKWIQRVSPA